MTGSLRIQLPMRLLKLDIVASAVAALALAAIGCAQPPPPPPEAKPAAHTSQTSQNYVGFDANEYPGDDQLPALRKQFAFTGYWLTNPPGADHNPWVGKRDILLRNGFGFPVVANGPA